MDTLHSRYLKQKIAFAVVRLSAAIVCLTLFLMVGFVVFHGWRAINWTFLTEMPLDSMTKGGIFPAIVGTFLLTFGAITVALPIGVASAVYLNEYARGGRTVRIIRLGINNLAGVPSVVFGLFWPRAFRGLLGVRLEHFGRLSDTGVSDPASDYRNL